jgi:hypothetical protein
MLRFMLMLASFANVAGGLALIGTWGTMWHRVPVVVLFTGGALLIQGAYTILYLHGELARWGDIATGAFFAGEGLSVCVGAAGIIVGLHNNLVSSDIEMAPVVAGILMCAQALLALLYLFVNDQLRPRSRRPSSV